MPNAPTIFVVDDDAQACKSVCALASSMRLAAEPFSSAEDFLHRYVPGRSGCLVTDVRMPGMNGLDLQEELRRRGIRLPVIVLTAYAKTPTTVRAIKAGAVTLLEKPYADNDLWDAIRCALAEDAAGKADEDRFARIRARIAQLTPGERQVMDLIIEGLPNKRIATALDLSLRAVERRRHFVFAKLQVNSAAELARIVVETQQSSPPRTPG